MADFSIDMSEIAKLSADLGKVPAVAVTEARKVLFKGSMNIKSEVQDHFAGHRYWKPLGRAVDFELVGLKSEVGFKDQGQGELAGIHEFGSSRRGPHPTLYPAAETERPKFERAMLDVGVKALRGLL